MATETVYLDGKAKFMRLFEPDTKYNKWSLLLYPDEPSLVKIKELIADGIKNKLKLDDDGYNMTFSRVTFREDKKSGITTPLAPPMVKEKDGKTNFPRTTRIGDGSDVHVGLEVYDHPQPGTAKRAKAARLRSVRIDNLVPDSRYVPTLEEEMDVGLQPLATF